VNVAYYIALYFTFFQSFCLILFLKFKYSRVQFYSMHPSPVLLQLSHPFKTRTKIILFHTSLLLGLWVGRWVITIFLFYLFSPWSESASELYRPSDRRLSAKWLWIK
jgi:hypothetical protein